VGNLCVFTAGCTLSATSLNKQKNSVFMNS
jgi:hypothetical protein